MFRFLVLDVETTGLNPFRCDRIIEIALVEIVNGSLTGRCFHSYIKPDVPVTTSAFKVHGLTDQFLFNKPSFINIVSSLIAFISQPRCVLVAHNAVFDARFLRCEFSRLGIEFRLIFIDTLKIFRKLFPGKRNDLGAICKRYCVDYSCLHGALSDAYSLAYVFLKFLDFKRKRFTKIA